MRISDWSSDVCSSDLSGSVDGKARRAILDLRADPKLSALMAAEYARANKAHLERSVGGTIGDTELYLAHFLGPAGAERFLSAMHRDPDRIAANILPEAASANRAIFYGRTGARSPDRKSQRLNSRH